MIGAGRDFEALRKPETPSQALNEAPRIYTRSAGYVMALAQKCSQRHVLDGTPVGPVSDEHRSGALTSVLRWQQRRDEKREQDHA